LKWFANDTYDSVIKCNVYVDGSLKTPNKLVTSGVLATQIETLSLGYHYWNTTCWDRSYNYNSSTPYYFNFTYPDFVINGSSISVNDTAPKENSTIQINVTVFNKGGADASNVKVSLFNGNPDLGGTQIGTNHTLYLAHNSSNKTSFVWAASIGTTQLFAVVDPPLATNGSFHEWNESNNEFSKNITVGSWQFIYGKINTSSNFQLADSSNSSLQDWASNLVNNGNIFVTDSDSSIDWTALVALGKYINGTSTTNDFSDVDSLLGMTGFNDSVTNIYTNSGTPKNTTDFNVFGSPITGVPIADSINNSNFTTGIFWDGSDDVSSDGQFDISDKEDLVFGSKIHRNTQGTFGVYDYEIRVPAKLRSYHGGSSPGVIYVELG